MGWDSGVDSTLQMNPEVDETPRSSPLSAAALAASLFQAQNGVTMNYMFAVPAEGALVPKTDPVPDHDSLEMEAHLRFLNMDLEMEVLDLESCFSVGEELARNSHADFTELNGSRLRLRAELAKVRQARSAVREQPRRSVRLAKDCSTALDREEELSTLNQTGFWKEAENDQAEAEEAEADVSPHRVQADLLVLPEPFDPAEEKMLLSDKVPTTPRRPSEDHHPAAAAAAQVKETKRKRKASETERDDVSQKRHGELRTRAETRHLRSSEIQEPIQITQEEGPVGELEDQALVDGQTGAIPEARSRRKQTAPKRNIRKQKGSEQVTKKASGMDEAEPAERKVDDNLVSSVIDAANSNEGPVEAPEPQGCSVLETRSDRKRHHRDGEEAEARTKRQCQAAETGDIRKKPTRETTDEQATKSTQSPAKTRKKVECVEKQSELPTVDKLTAVDRPPLRQQENNRVHRKPETRSDTRKSSSVELENGKLAGSPRGSCGTGRSRDRKGHDVSISEGTEHFGRIEDSGVQQDLEVPREEGERGMNKRAKKKSRLKGGGSNRGKARKNDDQADHNGAAVKESGASEVCEIEEDAAGTQPEAEDAGVSNKEGKTSMSGGGGSKTTGSQAETQREPQPEVGTVKEMTEDKPDSNRSETGAAGGSKDESQVEQQPEAGSSRKMTRSSGTTVKVKSGASDENVSNDQAEQGKAGSSRKMTRSAAAKDKSVGGLNSQATGGSRDESQPELGSTRKMSRSAPATAAGGRSNDEIQEQLFDRSTGSKRKSEAAAVESGSNRKARASRVVPGSRIKRKRGEVLADV